MKTVNRQSTCYGVHVLGSIHAILAGMGRTVAIGKQLSQRGVPCIGPKKLAHAHLSIQPADHLLIALQLLFAVLQLALEALLLLLNMCGP